MVQCHRTVVILELFTGSGLVCRCFTGTCHSVIAKPCNLYYCLLENMVWQVQRYLNVKCIHFSLERLLSRWLQ